MSSRLMQVLFSGLVGVTSACYVLVNEQGAIGAIGQSAAQQPQRFGAALARSYMFFHIGLSRTAAAGLGDGDHVQSTVDDAVAPAVEADLARGVARPHRDGRGAGESRIGVLGAEPLRPS